MSDTILASGIETLARIANECLIEFEISISYYDDDNINVYNFGHKRFVNIDKALDYALFFKEKHELNQKIAQLTNKLSRRIELHDIDGKALIAAKEEIKALTISFDKRMKIQHEVNIANDELIHTQAELTRFQIKEIRSLRSKLGHANRKIKELTK